MQNNVGVTSLFMCVLIQHDLEEAVAFYTKIGCALQFHLPGQWAEFRIGSVRLGLMASDVKQPDIRTGIVLEVKDLKAFYDTMSQQDVTFLNEPLEKPHGIMTAFKDPSGNILEVYQPLVPVVHEGAEGKNNGCAREKCCKSGADDDSTACDS